jgi:glutathione synthase/RimK-type ligase-like ATP-grasp enzyme
MTKKKKSITILSVGDKSDYDTFKKFQKEKKSLLEFGFDYVDTNYKNLLKGKIPDIKTPKVIVFLFFPFHYWNTFIEHKNYKGVYGNESFYRKFNAFWIRIKRIITGSLKGKNVFFINSPDYLGRYRDKLIVLRKLKQSGILVPHRHKTASVKKIYSILNSGRELFIKPRYGSMGKGITHLSSSRWQTNFSFKDNKIVSRKSDRGWKFRDITGKSRFLKQLLNKDMIVEDAVQSLALGQMKIDLRIYVFFNRVVYVYPRKNREDRVTTNISQGAKGDPKLLDVLPKHVVKKAGRIAKKTAETLGVNLLGMDIMPSRNKKDVYVLDVNLFPGLPKRRRFNISGRIAKELSKRRF